ncbi:hypothetical protein ABK040_010504 [Willaertia magna]
MGCFNNDKEQEQQENNEPQNGETYSKLKYDSDDEREEEDKNFKIDFTEPVTNANQLTRVKRKRKCPTDLPCLILFLIYCCGMIGVAIVAFYFGKPSILYYGTDFMGRTCGQDNTNAPKYSLKLPFDQDCINSVTTITTINGTTNKVNETARELCEEKVKPFKIDLTNQKSLYFMEILDPIYYGGVCVNWCPGSSDYGSSDTTTTVKVTDKVTAKVTSDSSFINSDNSDDTSLLLMEKNNYNNIDYNNNNVENIIIDYLNKSANCPPQLTTTPVDILGKFNLPFLKYCSYQRPDYNLATFPVLQSSILLSTQITYTSVINRCIPTLGLNATSLKNLIDIDFTNSNFTTIINNASQVVSTFWDDITRGWKVLVAALLLSILLGFIALLFIRLFTGIVVWVSLAISVLSFLGLSAFMIWYGYTEQQRMKTLQLSTTVPDVIFWFGVGIGIVGVIVALLVIFFFIRIRRAIAVIQESSKSLMYMPQVLIVPIIYAVIAGLFTAYWCVVSVFLYSAGEPTIEGGAVTLRLSNATRGIFAYHIFGGLWINAFLQATEYLILSGAICSWYWRKEKRFVVGLPLLRSTLRTLIFHLGTAAFGSLIVAIIQMIRILFEKIQKELETATKNNRIVKGCGWYVRIILWLVEKIIKFVNRQAYVQTSMYGTGFLTSAKNAFMLMIRNPIQMAVTHSMSTAVLFITKIAISCLTCLFTYCIASMTTFLSSDNKEINNPIFLTIIAFGIGYIVASLFIMVLQVAIDTVLQCYIIERELRQSNPNLPRFCTKSLDKFVDRQSKVKQMACSICCCFTCSCCGTHDDLPPVAQG